jgi:hypothetical protein
LFFQAMGLLLLPSLLLPEVLLLFHRLPSPGAGRPVAQTLQKNGSQLCFWVCMFD